MIGMIPMDNPTSAVWTTKQQDGVGLTQLVVTSKTPKKVSVSLVDADDIMISIDLTQEQTIDLQHFLSFVIGS